MAIALCPFCNTPVDLPFSLTVRCQHCGGVYGAYMQPQTGWRMDMDEWRTDLNAPGGKVLIDPEHPAYAASTRCSACSRPLSRMTNFRTEGRDLCRMHARELSWVPRSVPWEVRGTVGIFRAFAHTVFQVLLRPRAFFSAMPASGHLDAALLFAVLNMIPLILMMVGFPALGLKYAANLAYRFFIPFDMIFPVFFGSLALVTLASLAVLLMWFFATTWFYHVPLAIFGGNTRGYEATFRALAYSTPIYLVLLIPGVGLFLFFMLALIVPILAMERVHQISFSQAFAAWAGHWVMYPAVGVLTAVIAAFVAFATGVIDQPPA